MNELILFNVYLFYGLVFFTIGCVISFRNLKFSKLAIASALPALALFGFTHAFHEWSELYLKLVGGELSQQWWIQVKLLRIAKLLISFLALVWFAWQMLDILTAPHRRWVSYLVPTLLVLYLSATLMHLLIFPVEQSLLLSVQLTRWIFGLAGGSLAGVAMIYYARELAASHHQGAQWFGYCGVALLCYAIAAGLLSSNWGIWVPIVRMLSAFGLLLGLLQALKLFDLEYQQQIEEQQRRVMRGEKLRAIGELASGIAHEIKTPLSYATLGCDLLERQLDPNEAQKKQLQRIRHGLNRASHISQEVLHFARNSTTEAQPVELGQVIHSALDLMQHRLKPFRVQLDLDPELIVMGDEIKLEEVIINLVSNAIDASSDTLRLTISARVCANGIEVRVSDCGSGMEPSQLTQAMSPFFTTKPQGQGTGLGLPICQQIIQQHQGELTLSNGDTGLVAQFTLPRSAS
ncbi:His Kinase A (phospho-acceptor) domain-containing protein [Ferrimonas sediminum]|uniref:histidine kinase n=1 Tax=Ferrimonas sediminum TaxID=718193 RepID=A0A1G8JF25_9GAMM|nr:ATP-binding protein [Ferrimonas sediminum]SDI29785.1 His Kinase A (phospho-acceptor) domain-containing protein [Ferrimonas sediminum]